LNEYLHSSLEMNAERNGACEIPGSSSTNSLIYPRHSQVLPPLLPGQESDFLEGVDSLGVSDISKAVCKRKSFGFEEGHFSSGQNLLVEGLPVWGAREFQSLVGNSTERGGALKNAGYSKSAV